MQIRKIEKILRDTAYARTGGSEQERSCAEYLKAACEAMGLAAQLEPFEVPMAEIREAALTCDGQEVPCTGYFCAADADVEAPFCYLPSPNAAHPGLLSQCAGKIVLVDGYLRRWLYQDLLDAGAVGIITYDGHVNYSDHDIDQRELRAQVHQGNRLPCVHINVKDAVRLVKSRVETAHIRLQQREYTGLSHNVAAEIPGQLDAWILLNAHYDSVRLSQGAYDNMSGAIGLLGIAEAFLKKPHRYGLKLQFCGSEERGLLGSKAYVQQHEAELEKIVLNINLDMIGCVMGGLAACCTAEERLVHFIEYFADLRGVGIQASQGVRSSDSTSLADHGVPAVSFVRRAPGNTAVIHNRYDTRALVDAQTLSKDIDFLADFICTLADAVFFPVRREIPDNMKEKLDVYLTRTREKKK